MPVDSKLVVSESQAVVRKPACSIIKSGPPNGIDLIKEDEAGLLGASHLEQLAHHPGTFSHILLHQLTANDSDEAGICPVGHRSCQKSLACTKNAKRYCLLSSMPCSSSGPLPPHETTNRSSIKGCQSCKTFKEVLPMNANMLYANCPMRGL